MSEGRSLASRQLKPQQSSEVTPAAFNLMQVFGNVSLDMPQLAQGHLLHQFIDVCVNL